MSLGNSLFNARKRSGLSQEEAAEKLGVSRQTISKWELDETLPDIRQSQKKSRHRQNFFFLPTLLPSIHFKLYQIIPIEIFGIERHMN